MADLTISRGDAIELLVSITAPTDANLADFAFAVWRDPASPLAVLRTADLTIDDGTPDTVLVVVPGTATEDWKPGVYSYELKYQAPSGEPETIDLGTVVVRPSAVGSLVTGLSLLALSVMFPTVGAFEAFFADRTVAGVRSYHDRLEATL